MGVRLRGRRGQSVGTRDERNLLRMILVGIVGVFMFAATYTTSPAGMRMASSVKQVMHNTVGSFVPRSLLTNEMIEPKQMPKSRRLSAEDCAEEFPDILAENGDIVEARCDSNNCLFDEEFEGACCIPNLEENPNNEFVEAERCFTLEGIVCAGDELCVAELIPGSGVGAQCFREFEEGAGGAILYLFLLLYLFLALAIVCDDYFTYSLDMLGDLLGMSSDVKGATFAAIGSSAPELFVSLADNVIANPPKSVGIGTIVGSAIFNILVIIGASAIVAGREFKYLQLDYKPLMRDSFFYIISICGLIGVALSEESARHFEGGILLVLYALYLVFMVFNKRIFDKMDRFFGTGQKSADGTDKKDGELKKAGTVAASAAEDVEILNEEEEKADAETGTQLESTHATGTGFTSGSRRNLKRGSTLNRDGTLPRKGSIASAIGKGKLTENEDTIGEEPYFSVLYWPTYKPPIGENGLLSKAFGGGIGMWAKRLYFLFVLPINIFFRFTIPDARYDLFCEDRNGRTDRRKIGYWLEFFMCVAHIALFSHFLVFSAAKFGCIVGIPASIMGLTVLAAGTSVPDMITSIILTKNGEGDAAVANSIGSNVFDILVGLGLPWLLAEFVFGEPSAVATGDIGVAIGFLFGVLIVLLVALAITRFRLNFPFGVGLILLYVMYVVFELAIRPVVLPSE